MREAYSGGVILATLLLAITPAASSSTAIEGLLLRLSSEEPEVVLGAIEAAGASQEPIFVEPLVQLARSEFPTYRQAALGALGELGVPPDRRDLNTLLGALEDGTRDPNDEVQRAAVVALGRYPFPEAERRLLALAEGDGPPAVKAAAERALAERNPREAEQRLARHLALGIADAQRRRAKRQITEVERFGPGATPLALIAQALLGPDPRRHAAAVDQLKGQPAKAARPLLGWALLHPDPAVRRRSASQLANLDQPWAPELLRRVLLDADVATQEAAIRTQGRAPGAEATRALFSLLDTPLLPPAEAALAVALAAQPDPLVLAAIRARPLRPTPQAFGRLFTRVKASTSPGSGGVRVELLLAAPDRRRTEEVLARLAPDPDPEVLPALLSRLSGSAPGSPERARLLAALGERGAPEIAPALIELILRGQGDEAVAEALRPRLGPNALAALLPALDSTEAPTRRAALLSVAHERGPLVAEAAGRALRRAPNDRLALDLLGRQELAVRLEVLLTLLADPALAPAYGPLFALLQGAVDPRLGEVVVTATRRASALAPSAIELLAVQNEPGASAALAALARAPELAPEHRSWAIRRLSTPSTADRIDLLLPLAADEDPEVKLTARRALHQLAPRLYPDWDPYGRAPLVLESAVLGATMMVVANEIAGADLSPAFTGSVGLLLGGATPFLLTLDEDVTLGEATYFGTYGLWGTLAGVGLGQRLFSRRQDQLFFTLGGEAAGVALGALTMRATGWGPSEAALANTTALEVSLVTAGLTALIARNDEDRASRSLHYGLVGGAAGVLPMAFLARRLVVEDRQDLILSTTLHGAALGGFASGLFAGGAPIDDADVAAGIAAGQGLGYLVGLAWAQGEARPSQAELLASGVGAGWGLLTGGGLALLLDDRRAQAGALEVGLLGGALTLGILGPELELSGNDPVIVGLVAAGGALAAADLSVRLAEGTLEAREVGGRLMFGAGLGLGLGLALSQVLELSDRTLYGSLAGGVLLGAAGFGLGELVPELDVRSRSRLTGLSLLGGVALTLPFSEGLELDERAWAYGGLSAATLGLSFALWPSFDTAASEPIAPRRTWGGATFGASLGLAAGLTLAQTLDLGLGQLGILGGGTVATAGIGAGLGLLSRAERPVTSGLLSGGAILGLAAGTLILQGGWLDTPGSGPDRTLEIATHTAAFVAHGAVQGSLLAGALREEPTASEVAGGAMVGAGAGALLGLTVAQLLDEPLTPPDLIEASVHTSLALGAAACLYPLGVDRRFASQLAEGIGLLSYLGAYTLAPATSYGITDTPTLILGAGTLGALGYLTAPALGLEHSPSTDAGAFGLGATAGALAASLYTQLQPERDDPFLAATLLSGAGIGAGAGLLLDDQVGQGAAALTQAGLGLGLVAGLTLSPEGGYSLPDHLLTATLAAEGGWLGAQLPLERGVDEPRRQGGGAALGAGLGLATGLTLGRFLEPEVEEVLELSTFGLLGASLGGGLLLALPDEEDPAARWAVQGAGLFGLGLGALVAPTTEYQVEDVTAAALTAGAGAYAGAFLPFLFGESTRRQQVGGALAGGSAGLMAGLLLAELRPLALDAQIEAGAGAVAGGAIGHGLGLLLPELSPRTQGLLGAGLSLGTYGLAALIAPSTSYDEGDRLLIPLGAALGTSFGLTLPILLGRDPEAVTEAERSGGMLVGAGSGALLMGALSQVVELSPLQVGGGAAAAAVGHGVGYGLGLLLEGTTPRSRLGLMSGIGELGLFAGLALAPTLNLDDTSPLTMGTGAVLGAAWAAPAPLYFGDRAARRYGGAALLGTALGLSAGLVVDQLAHPGKDALLEANLGAAMGGLSGVGLGLAATTDDRWAAGLGQGLSVAGALTLGALLPAPPEHDLGDLALGSAYVGYLTWHAVGLSLLTEGTDRQAAGLVLTTVGLGAVTGRYLTPYLNLELEDVLMLLAGNMWGTWIGGWGGQVVKDELLSLDDTRQSAGLTLLASAAGSDVGLAVTALVVSGLLDVEPTRFAVINLAGLTGMMTGMLVASAAEREPLKMGNVAGSLAGLVLGAVVTSFFDFSRTPTWDELLGKTQAAPATAQVAPPAAPTGLPEIESWFPSAQVQANQEGEPQYLLTVQGTW